MNKIKLFFKRWLLKRRLKKGELIIVDNSMRGIGKSTMLVKQAMKYDIPIIIGSQSDWDYLKSISMNIDVVRLAKNFTFEFRGRDYPNGILIEESVAPEMVEWIKERNVKIRGGFIKRGNSHEN